MDTSFFNMLNKIRPNHRYVRIVRSSFESEPSFVEPSWTFYSFANKEPEVTKPRDVAKESYYEQVWLYTELNASNVPNIELRGKDYHIDHIVPISYGYKNSIPAEVIGGLQNLQILSKKDNFRKGARHPHL